MNAAQTRDLAAVEDARPVSVEPASSEDVTAIFRKEGDFWTIAWQGKVSRVKDIKGLAYVAQLLRYPGKEFHAFDLVAGTDSVLSERIAGGTGTAGGGHDEERIEDMGLRPGLPEDAGEMLDSTVKAAYRRRLSELREELEEAKKRGNVERASNAEDEIEFLNRELARAVGISGHDRRAASTSERARLNATRAIRTALRRIGEKDPSLGQILSRTIRTGLLCSYTPDSNSPVNWNVSSAVINRHPRPFATRG